MESRDSFPRPPAPSYAPGTTAVKGIAVPTGEDTAATDLTSSSGSSSSLTLSPFPLVQQYRASKRASGPMQSKLPRPRATRVLVSGGDRANKVNASPSVAKDHERKVTQPQRVLLGSCRLPNAMPNQQKVDVTSKLGSSAPEELMLTAASSMLKGTTDTHTQSVNQQKSEANLLIDMEKPALEALSSQITSCNALMGGGFKKGQHNSVANPQLTSQSDNIGITVDSRMDSMLSYLHSVSWTAGDNFPANQGTQYDHQQNHQELEIVDAAADIDIKYDAPNLSQKGIEEARNHNPGEPMTRFSAIGSSVTAMSLHSGPTFQSSLVQMPESAVESSKGVLGHGSQKEHAGATGVGDWNPHNQQNHQELEIVDAAADIDIKYDVPNLSQKGIEEARNHNLGEPMTRFSAIGSSVTAMSLHSGPTFQSSLVQMPESAVESSKGVLGHGSQKEHAGATGVGDWNPHNQQVQNLGNGATDKAVSSIGRLRSEGLPANDQSTSARDGGASQPNMGEKERRKKNYDPNLFFKVNGKLYQKLGKIGSGGSSEVHKVISSDCIIYALKKIKLRGRDYPTAYGFCQEIEYLNKLKGKSNIIQMIDYEVTDKSLLLESSVPPRGGRIKDDHYIYMVLEYGEIDLANMVSQKWKERNNSNMKIDENWLRFYWQQMLEAVNTIHEERIVHSDLKPANFMLVRGSLKLIDFGIAKAIMNDTTNIQRDGQVGTLNYMSPEAFMCNDTDSGGNVIKCGRPSDIWSLGCILYQMVYGKTPFANYKTFWTKYKEVTNRNHKIMYEPVDNPWLIDLMQRCLAWDRNERWRIPQLLKHPFLNPLVPKDVPSSDNDPYRLLMERIRVHLDNPVAQKKLCSLVEELDGDQ